MLDDYLVVEYQGHLFPRPEPITFSLVNSFLVLLSFNDNKASFGGEDEKKRSYLCCVQRCGPR